MLQSLNSLGSKSLSVLLLSSTNSAKVCQAGVPDCRAVLIGWRCPRRAGAGGSLLCRAVVPASWSSSVYKSLTSALLLPAPKYSSTARCTDPDACCSSSRRRLLETEGPRMSRRCSTSLPAAFIDILSPA